MDLIRRFFMPSSYAQSVPQIDLDRLMDKDVKDIITDLDNTLVGRDVKRPTRHARAWFKEANEKGVTITVVSSNSESRAASFSQYLDTDFIFKAREPTEKTSDKAIIETDIRPDQAVVIGDQMFTDVFDGNHRGLYTVMVVPVRRTGGFITKFNKLVERRLLRHFNKKGYITWEEN